MYKKPGSMHIHKHTHVSIHYMLNRMYHIPSTVHLNTLNASQLCVACPNGITKPSAGHELEQPRELCTFCSYERKLISILSQERTTGYQFNQLLNCRNSLA